MKKIITLLILCILSISSAYAMTEDHALEIASKNIPGAKDAANITVFPSKEYDGAFAVVTCSTNKDTSFSAEYWYVTDDDTYLLGKGDSNWQCGLLEVTPEVFYNSYGPGKDRSSKACVIVDNVPVLISNANKIYSFYSHDSKTLIGYVGFQDYDYAFLRVDMTDHANPVLCQIHAKILTRNEFLDYNGADEIISTIEKAGYSIDSCLYWDGSAIALNCTRDNTKYHVYIYMIDGKLQMQGGWWGDDIGMLDGFASATRNLDMTIIETE